MKIHILKKGESLYELSQKFKVPLEQLISANPHIENPDAIMAGTKIKIPSPASTAVPAPAVEVAHQHKVKQGDSLWKLGKAWGIPLKDMIDANPQLKNPNALMTGEIVNIPKVKGDSAVVGESNVHGSQVSENTTMSNKKYTGVKEEAQEENTSNLAMPYEMFEMPEIPEMPPIPQQLPENVNVKEETESKKKEENEKAENVNIENMENTANVENLMYTENTNAAAAPENIQQSYEPNKSYEMPIYETYSPPYISQSDVNNMYPGIMAEHANPNMPAATAVNPASYSEDNHSYSYEVMYSNNAYGENSEFKPKWEPASAAPANSKFGEHSYHSYPNPGYTTPLNPYTAGESFIPPFYPNPCYPTMYTAASNMPSNNNPYVPMSHSPYTGNSSAPMSYYPPTFSQEYGLRTELNQPSELMDPSQEELSQIHSAGLINETEKEPEQASTSTAKSTAKAKVSNKSTSVKKLNERKAGNREKRNRSAKPKRKNPWLNG